MHSRRPRLLVLALTLVTASLFLSPLPSGAATPKTRIVLDVHGCNGCRVTPVQAKYYVDGANDYWTGRTVTVRDGKAVLVVPRGRTRGLTLEMSDAKAGGNSLPLVVVRYAGHRPGTLVTKRQAATAKNAYACWAGTSRAKVSWRVQVGRFPALKYTPNGTVKSYAIRPYVVRTKQSFGPAHETWKGSLGTQDTPYCGAGPSGGRTDVVSSGRAPDARAAATNPRCISRVEYRKLRMTARPWASGTTLRQARSIIGSLGTTQLAPKHRYDTEFDGYDEHVGLDYRTAAYAFGVVPEYIFGAGGKTRPCKPWNKHSSVVLIFRQYNWKGGHGPWRLVGPKAPTPSTDAAGFRGVSWAHWKHN